MPTIRASILQDTPVEKKKALAQALTQAVVDALGVPTQAVTVYLEEFSKENIAVGGVTFAERPPAPPK